MIKSMTGYGKAHRDSESFSISTEIKTLNSKYLDIQLKIPRSINDKEIEIRQLISDHLERGKVSLSLEIEFKSEDLAAVSFNKVIFRKYYRELKELADSVGDSGADCFRLAAAQPDVAVQKSMEELPEELWTQVQLCIVSALENCNDFRSTEGEKLSTHLQEYNNNIASRRLKVVDLEKNRAPKVRERLSSHLEKLSREEKTLDQNRLEQEIIYYIEKLDITEEIDRLGSHCDYFKETINKGNSPGKKLGFICQEIGREINTIGSKANDSEIQKEVVFMKEDLEKMKEQSLNIL